MTLDPRLLKVVVDIDGVKQTFTDLFIEVTATKYDNNISSEAEIRIMNLKKDTRDWVIKEGSPFNYGHKTRIVEVHAGRESTGYSLAYFGQIFRASITQPPDIGLTIKCITAFNQYSNISLNGAKSELFSSIVRKVANAFGYKVNTNALKNDFKTNNFQVAQSSFSLVLSKLQEMAEGNGVTLFLDGNILVVKDANAPLTNNVVAINSSTGMIGIPELNEQSVKVKFMYNPNATIGSLVQITSELNPAANGTFYIYKLDYDLANRSESFYMTAYCTKAII